MSSHTDVPRTTDGDLAADRADQAPRLTAALAALAFLVLSAFSSPADGPPPETATAAQIRDHLTQHAGAMRLEAVGIALVVCVLLVLTAALARLVRNRLPGSLLADVVAGAGVLVVLRIWLSGAVDTATLALRLDGTDPAGLSDNVLLDWYAATGVLHFFSDLWMVCIVMLVGAFSLAALRARLVPRWLAWAGLVVAGSGAVGTIGVAVGSVPLASAWFGGIFGWVVWTVAVGVALGGRWLRVRRAG
jgi:hypothetical protein